MQDVKIDHGRAVKKYHRPAAGNEAPLPEDIRPAPVLQKTMDYLLGGILDAECGDFSDKHKYVRDRTRSIRQDITVQQRSINRDPQALLTTVKLHEQMARFHILSGHRLCETDQAEFDPFQNNEQLRKVLQSLQEYYVDIRKMISELQTGQSLTMSEQTNTLSLCLTREAEFRGYQVLSHAEDQDVFRRVLSFPREVFSSPAVQFALTSASALHQVDYVAYGRMMKQADYLQACLLHTHLQRLRKNALKMIFKSFSSKAPLPALDVARWLTIEKLSELESLLASQRVEKRINPIDGLIYEIPKQDHFQNDILAINEAPLGGATKLSTELKPLRSDFVEAKVAHRPISEIIRGYHLGGPTDIVPIINVSVKSPSQLPAVPRPTTAARNGFPMVATSPVPISVAQSQPSPLSAAMGKPLSVDLSMISKVFTEDLLKYCVLQLLPKYALEAISKESTRRKQLQERVLQKSTASLLNCFAREFVNEIALGVFNSLQYRKCQESHRTLFISKLTNRLTEDILKRAVKDHFKILFPRPISKQPRSENVMFDSQSIIGVSSLGPPGDPLAMDGFATPFSQAKSMMTAKTWNQNDKRGMSISSTTVETPFLKRLRFQFEDTPIKLLGDAVLASDGDNLRRKLQDLNERAQQERLESQKLEELLQKAVNS